ncbi:MAG: DUF3306 domain-containing protein [Proteobacteria bacterium]|nr:DUF3306 domain-containing protein [Pseudomonadota bacterium]
MARTDERFIGRWSRLKQKRRRREPGPGDVPKDESARPEPADAQPATGEEETAALDLPDIETLDKDSDFTVFMKEGVPEELKKLALRKLWRSDPVFAVIDGLDDYDEDYRTAFVVAENLAKRLKKSGKGAADHGTEAEGDEGRTEEGGEAPAPPVADGGRETGAGDDAKAGERAGEPEDDDAKQSG